MFFKFLAPLIMFMLILDAESEPAGTQQLLPNDELLSFLHMLPLEKMNEVTKNHSLRDPGFQAAVKYIQSKEWVNLLRSVAAKPEYIAINAFYKIHVGFDLNQFMRCIGRFFNRIKIEAAVDPKVKKSLASYLIDLEKIIPVQRVVEKINKKFGQNGVYEKIIKTLESQESFDHLQALRHSPEFQRFSTRLVEMEVPMDNIFTAMYIFFGWETFKSG